MSRFRVLIGAIATATLAAVLWGHSPAQSSETAPQPGDGTLIQRGTSSQVAMLLDGNRIDFDDEAAARRAGCAEDSPQPIPSWLFDALPTDPDPLYAAVERDVAVEQFTPEPRYRTDCHAVYRADGRDPETIFDAGFAPKDAKNGQYDIRSYVLTNQPSPLVSTTYRDDLYKDWKPRFYYQIDAPGGIDINATIGDDHKFADQVEVAFPGGVDARFIVEGCPVDRASLTIVEDECRDNPNYVPWRG